MISDWQLTVALVGFAVPLIPYYRKEPHKTLETTGVLRGSGFRFRLFSLVFSLYRFKTAFAKPSMRSALAFFMASVKCA